MLDKPTQAILIRKLDAIFELAPAERDAIAAIPFHVRTYAAHQDVARERDHPSQCCILLGGVACRYKMVGAGRRQIFSFHFAGDIPDLQSLHIEVMDHNFASITPITAGFVPHETLRAFLRDHPRIADVFWRDTLIEASIYREWMAGLGARSAYARVAHLFCEIMVRQKAVDLIAEDAHEMPLPLTQTEMADALGLSPVHINRTLQVLRAEGLIAGARGTLIVRDWHGLQKAGDFDRAYLHLRETRH
jgi:CRP-like cAMP-binding protein